MADRYASLKQGLVGAWIPSVSGSGLLLPDLSGRGNNGVLTNMDASDWVSASYGRALDFDGSNDFVDTGTQLSFLDGNSEFTMCFWGQRRSSGAALTVGKRSGGNYILIAPWIDGNVYFELSGYFPAVASNLTSWAHYAMTLRGATIRGYINGSQVVSTAGPNTIPSVSANYVMGLEAGVPRYSDGQIDDFRVYSRALTESEIRLLSSEPGIGFKRSTSAFSTRYTYKPPKAKVFEGVRVRDHDYASLRQGLVGAWCPSLPNGGSGNTLPDQSGRGNHGTLTNMGPEDWVSSQYGRALDFDGVNDYAIANRPTFPVATTFSCWVKPTTGALSGLMSTRDTVSLLGVDFYLNSNGTVVFYCPSDNVGSNRSFFTTTNAVASGQWVHLVGRWQSSTLNDVWVNGSEAAGILTGTIQSTLTPRNSLRFGCLGVLSFLTGCLDDIRVYDRVLSPSEIRLLASRPGIGLQPSPTRLIAREKKTGLRRKILTGQT